MNRNIYLSFVMVLLVVGLVSAVDVNFVSPTPSDGNFTEQWYTILNASVNSEGLLSKLIISKNDINYSIIDDSLQLYYQSNNISDFGENETRVADLSGNGRNGTVKYAEGWGANYGKYGGSYDFNGSGYIDTDYTSDFNNGSVSWCLWFNLYNNNSQRYTDIFSKSYSYRLYYDDGDNAEKIYVVNQKQAGGDVSIVTDPYSIDFNKWYHVCTSYDASVNTTTMYLNGVVVGSKAQAGIIDSTAEFRVGSNPNTGFTMNGTVDDVYIWNKSINQEFVKRVYDLSVYSENYTNHYITINKTNPFYTEISDYEIIVTNSSNDEASTGIRTFISSAYITFNSIYSTIIGTTRDIMYGSNTHVDMQGDRLIDTNDNGSPDTTIDFEWHRARWLESKQDNQRGDMYLSNYYNPVLMNKGFENWLNTTSFNINDTGHYNVIHNFWDISTYNFEGYYGGWFERSTDSHSGSYSLNVTNNNTESGLSNPEAFVYTQLTLKNETANYNITGWIKSDNKTTFKAGWNDGAITACNTNNTAGDWQYVNCNFTSEGIYTSIRFDVAAGVGESFLLDDIEIYKNNELYEFENDISLENLTELVDWAAANNQYIMFIADRPNSDTVPFNCKKYPQPFFTDNCYGNINYTQYYTPSIIHFLNSVTRNGTNIDNVIVEVTNEPYFYSNWLGNISNDEQIGADEYVLLYNDTYNELISEFPTLTIGGPSGFRRWTNLSNSFIGNFSGKFDFISIHPYADSSYVTENRLVDDVEQIFSICSDYSVDCPWIILSEWTTVDTTLKNYSWRQNEYEMQLVWAYQSILNTYPANVTFQYYQWNEQYRYNNSAYYPEYPQRWTMVTEPSLVIDTDPMFKAPYNATAKMARYARGNIGTSSVDYDSMAIVSTTYGNKKNLILINTNNESINSSMSTTDFTGYLYDVDDNELYDFSSGTADKTIVLEPYEVAYLTEPVLIGQGAGVDIYGNHLGEELYRVANGQSIGSTCDAQTNIFFNLILILAALAIVSIAIFYIYQGGWENIDYKKVLLLGIALIVCVILFQASAQNLGVGNCL